MSMEEARRAFIEKQMEQFWKFANQTMEDYVYDGDSHVIPGSLHRYSEMFLQQLAYLTRLL